MENPSLGEETTIRISGKFPNMNETTSLSSVKIHLNELVDYSLY